MRKFLLTFLGFALVLIAHGQSRTVTGRVTAAEDGNPLPGVNVSVKGTTEGTFTDAGGKYSISVTEENTVLVFSFVGFSGQEISLAGRTHLEVQLASSTRQLEEIVVTAQGIERTRNELPYAAQRISGDDVSRTRDANLLNSLSGRVAGVQIQRNNSLGGSTNVVIRGVKSLTGNNQALFVVDGVPIDNSNTNSAGQKTGGGGYDYGNYGADINPDDVESINVLKGAAATALYGSRAANGVILITTKKGTRRGVGVTFNTGLTFGSIDPSTFPTYQNQYGAGYGKYYESPDGFFLYRDINGDGADDLVAPTSEDASYGGKFDPKLAVYQWDAFDPTSPNFGKATPWVAAKNGPESFFRRPVSQSHSVMLDGKSEKGSFKLGYSRNDDQGILPNSHITKNFVNFGASYEIVKNLTASASINFTQQKGQGRYGTGYDDKNMMTNFRQWWQTNVDVQAQRHAYERTKQNITWNWADPSTDVVPIYWDNPYFTRYESYENDERNRYFGNVRLDYKISESFSVFGRISLDSYNEIQEERRAVGSVDVPGYQRFNRSFIEYNYDLLLNYNRKLSSTITLRGVLGTNIRRTTIQSIFAATNGGLVVPRLYALSNSKNTLNPPLEAFSDLKVNGVFANATLGLRNLLFFDLAVRRDEASSLPVENNSFFYPSASLSFVFSELVGDNDWLTGGKLRVNYAEVGNTAPTSSLANYYDKPTAFGTQPLFSMPGTQNNSKLRPERTKSFEAGIEANFFDNRIGFDLTYYQQNTVDQIIPVNISTATGRNSKFINAGDVQNRGLELSLNGSPVRTPKFSWEVAINWTRNRNNVKELYGIDNLQLGAFQGGVSVNAALGQAYGTIRGSNFVFDKNGDKVIGADGYYLQSTTSNEIIGNVNPDWIGGVNNTLKFKNISLSFLIDVKRGGDVFSLDMYYGLATGLYPETVGLNDMAKPVRDALGGGGGVILEGVKADGTKNTTRVSAANYGLFGYVRNPAAAFIYDASYVKLRELTINYSIPSSIIKRLKPLMSVDISLIGRNLLLIHKNLPYSDPEENLSSGNIQGYQVGAYPMTRNIGFNVRAVF